MELTTPEELEAASMFGPSGHSTYSEFRSAQLKLQLRMDMGRSLPTDRSPAKRHSSGGVSDKPHIDDAPFIPAPQAPSSALEERSESMSREVSVNSQDAR